MVRYRRAKVKWGVGKAAFAGTVGAALAGARRAARPRGVVRLLARATAVGLMGLLGLDGIDGGGE